MSARIDRTKKQSAFTLIELFVCIIIVLIVAAILYPVFAPRRRHSSRTSCASNEKQLGLAFLEYAQDYDEHLPLASSSGAPTTAMSYPGDKEEHFPRSTWENSVLPYVRSGGPFHCPDVPSTDNGYLDSDYRYNDLVAGVKADDMVTPSKSLLLMDGDLKTNDVGHAWTPDETPQPAVVNRKGLCEAGQGATVKGAVTRHTGHAVYLFADGHVKAFSPAQVFFPPRASASRSHKDADGLAVGPDPAGSMTFAGSTYAATFHLR